MQVERKAGNARRAGVFVLAVASAGSAAAGCAGGSRATALVALDDPNGPPVTRVSDDGAADQRDASAHGDAGAPGDGDSADANLAMAAPPAIERVAPRTAVVDGASPTLVITGKHFTERSVLHLDGAPLATWFAGSTELRATLPAGSLARVGPLPLIVDTPPPGGGRSAAVMLEVVNPPPVTVGLTPMSAAVGAGATPLVVAGSGFVAGSIVVFQGADLPTVVVSPVRLEATVPASSLASSGAHAVHVRTPSPGGGVSRAIAFTVADTRAVAIESVEPVSATVGAGPLTLRVQGGGFVAMSTVLLNGTALATTYVSPLQLTARVPATLLASAGDLPVSTSTSPGGALGIGPPVPFHVVNPMPAIVALTPDGAREGSMPTEVSVRGDGFVPDAQVTFAGAAAATTFVGGTELRATLAAEQLATARTIDVRVVTPGPGGGTSPARSFAVSSR